MNKTKIKCFTLILLLIISGYILLIVTNAEYSAISSSDYEEISSLSDEMEVIINTIIENERKEHLYTESDVILDGISHDDIDNSRYICIYNNIVSFKKSKLDCRSDNEYHYEYIANINNTLTVRVTYLRNLPPDQLNLYAVDENGSQLLDDDAIQYYITQSGKWHINSIGIDYLNVFLESMLKEDVYQYFYIPEIGTIAGIREADDMSEVFFANSEIAEKYGLYNGINLNKVIAIIEKFDNIDITLSNVTGDQYGSYITTPNENSNIIYTFALVIGASVIITIIVIKIKFQPNISKQDDNIV